METIVHSTKIDNNGIMHASQLLAQHYDQIRKDPDKTAFLSIGYTVNNNAKSKENIKSKENTNAKKTIKKKK